MPMRCEIRGQESQAGQGRMGAPTILVQALTVIVVISVREPRKDGLEF